MEYNNKIMKNISSLKQELLGPYIIPNNYTNNFNTKNKINKTIGTITDKLSNKIELLRNIKTEDEENYKEVLDKIFIENINKLELVNKKKEKLKNIDLIEKNANDLYNWNILLNKRIPLEKRNEYNTAIKKKKFSSFIKKNYNLINYKKGKNVLCKVSNESLLNFYKDIPNNRIFASELSPKVKLRNKNLISNLINSGKLDFKSKKEILNYLTLNEKENAKFKDEDLVIANKRRDPDILIKTCFGDNKIIENNKNNSKINRKIKKNKKMKKKPGLILSYYDENNPDIIKFNEKIQSLSEQNRKTTTRTLFDDIKQNGKITNLKFRNILSAKNMKIKDNKLNNMFNDKDDIKNFSNGTTDLTMNSNEANKFSKNLNFFKEKKSNKSNNISLKFYSNKSNKNTKNILFCPKSSSTIINNNQHNYLYFLNNKSNKKSLSYEDFNEIEFMQGFPKKKSSNVGNSIYDKINRILKHRFIKKFKLNSKKYYKNLFTITINNKYKQDKEESKNNKLIQTFISENLKTSITKSSENEIILSKNIINKDKESSSSKNDKENKLNKKTNNFYSCSNNYAVNIRRKNKNKLLNELFGNDYLNKIIFKDKFNQKN